MTGTGFVSGSTTVDFGSAAGSSVNVTSSTSLTVVVPSGTGTVSLTVSTTAGGSSAPLANAYTYNGPPTVSAVSPNNGPQGGTNTVTVTGTGFVSGSTTVDFGSAAGSSVSVTGSTSLTVVVPSGTGTVSLTVSTTAGGSSAPLANAYTYNGPPTVTAVSPNNGPQGGTNTVTVTGTGFVSGSTTVDFGSAAGSSVNVTGSTSLTVVVPSGTGTVSLTVSTTAGGSSAPLANAYTYNGPPTVTGVSPNNGPSGRGQLRHGGRHRVRLGLDHGRLRLHSGHLGQRDRRLLAQCHRPGRNRHGLGERITAGGGGSAPLANAYTYNAPSDRHFGQPEQRAGGRRDLGHGQRHRLDRARHGRELRLHAWHRDHRRHRHQPHGHRSGRDGHGERHVVTPNGTSAVNAPSDQYTFNDLSCPVARSPWPSRPH